MGKGYMGKVLIVDLGERSVREEEIPDRVYRQYLSGMGLGAYMLYKHIPAGADPLGPDNMIGFVSGLLTGTGSLFTGRWTLVGKSPLTGAWGDANCGGTFSPAIKRCGYDGIFVRGISETPVYLYIDDHGAELRDASEVWGKDTVETETHFRQGRKGRRIGVACIGPAGESVSLISGVATDYGRMAARSGLGAVMGAKRLKALVLAGNKRIAPHNRKEMKRLSAICNKWVQFQPPFMSAPMMAGTGALMRWLPSVMAQDGILYKIMLKKWGTVAMNQMSVEMGDSPIKNWKGSSKDWGMFKSRSSSPSAFTKCEQVKYHCYSCPLGCGGICSTDGKYKETHKPEYETVLSLGGLLLNKDMDSIFYLNELLNRAGMDSISAGHAVAFAIECYEEGVFTKKDTGGLALSWGDSETIVTLIEKMVAREGIGHILADGVKQAAHRIGEGSEAFAVHAGGQEPAMHDSRNDPGFALHYSVEPSPGKHTVGSGLYYEMFKLWQVVDGLPKVTPLYMKGSKYKADEEKAVIGAANSRFMNVVNGSGACLFGTFLGARRVRLFDWLNAATGWTLTPNEYMEVGANVQTLRQAFNVRHGIEPKSFKISDRALGRPVQSQGANKGRTVAIEEMMRDYWTQFGWDPETGKPLDETIRELEAAM
ncbi:aldehyde ferredoxin oxidoreductase family protein [Desulfoluna butyratoxydans]|uniref:Aldehyde ferredoxin oxidoreductase c-terminal n=1 Tax=Desulfoluna butyratoxydans TaxID=231438 RepID=A0A4V6IM40_9BACT|nr:aldehyde ferredoxin oxidoreductase family protein [Desulfoluna butyratoxydans]VFQ47348.1 aldehyde ferredoxin oxidoreductase c-terminal [Desulfoluna butyratoxydans]